MFRLQFIFQQIYTICVKKEDLLQIALGKKRIKGVRTQLEKDLLKMMIDYDVDQTDLANHEGVTPQAINNRLKRLNDEKFEVFKKMIIDISNNSNS